MSKDARTFLLVLVGAVTATILLGSLARAHEYWAIPVILALGALVLIGIVAYRKRKVEKELLELARTRKAMLTRAEENRRRRKGGRNE